MTLVVGLEHAGKVWMAGDSSVGSDGLRHADRISKVAVLATGLALGVAGNGRETDLALNFKPPRPPKDAGYGWMVTEFVPRLWATFTADAIKRDNIELELLLGLRGTLWSLDSYGGVGCARDGLDAIGAAAPCAMALGSLDATGRYPPELRLRRALRVASRRTTAVLPPWTMVSA